ncbi:MAG: cupin domain-containing protein [Firmicutes bacterium]|jgi:mannose-6-phosphate isomerase-like protein (cupin superfamily)|nr:cupin domain-containing protein [Bacillota bacterium]
MAVRVVSLDSIEPQRLPGRDLQWLVTPETIGAEQLSIAIMTCPGKSVVKPLHSHRDIEEVILILEGEGEAWVDGETATFKKGDAVLFPANSKHQVRNTGDGPLITASIFSAPTSPDSYIIYDEDVFE